MHNPFQKKIHHQDFSKLIILARLEVYEPFEGEQNLERLQKTRASLEKGVEKVVKKASNWMETSNIVAKTKGRIAELRNKIKHRKKSSDSKLTKIGNVAGNLAKKINYETKDMQSLSKEKLRDLQTTIWEGARIYTLKGFDLLWRDNPESWILPQASRVLARNLNSLEELQNISTKERTQLIKQLYPYDSQGFQKLAKGFEVSVNVTLGLIVATNMPGTGLLVSGINTIKTIVKIAIEIQVLSALYGYQIQSQEALFTLCGQIIASMEDFESQTEHSPLSYEVLTPLFEKKIEKNQKSFETLIAEAFKKEAYIAIPGVGMLSLGKIQLDDYKAEQMTLALLEKRNLYLELSNTLKQKVFISKLEEMKIIFKKLYSLQVLTMLKSYLETQSEEEIEKSWLKKLQSKTRANVFPALDKVAELIYMKNNKAGFGKKDIDSFTMQSIEEIFLLLDKDTSRETIKKR